MKTIHNLAMSVPVNVTWEITTRCNLSCIHCLSADIMADCKNELDLTSCKKIIDDLSKLKVFQVNIGGGEPFMRVDIIDILNYCHEKGIVTCISTNATCIDNDTAKKLAQMNLTYIQISLEGANPESNDKLRGAGSFIRAINGIEALSRYGFKNLSINTVVTRANYREIPELCTLARQHGAKTRLSRFKPSGRGKSIWDEYCLSSSQIDELSELLQKHRTELTGDSFFLLSAEDRQSLALQLCGAAKMTCSISPYGNIYPCAVLQEDRFCAGNVLEQSLRDIWNDSEVFKIIRNLAIDSCANCLTFDYCHAGCIAFGFFIRDHLNSKGSACINNVLV